MYNATAHWSLYFDNRAELNRLNAIARECIIKSQTHAHTHSAYTCKHPNRFANRHTHAFIAYSYYLHAITSLSGLIKHINSAGKHTHRIHHLLFAAAGVVYRWIWNGNLWLRLSNEHFGMMEIWSTFRVHPLLQTHPRTHSHWLYIKKICLLDIGWQGVNCRHMIPRLKSVWHNKREFVRHNQWEIVFETT